MAKFKFSGHESFLCKHFWLKKGYDFLKEGHSFNDSNAVVHLGVGKNMVNSIRFWLKAFGIVDDRDCIQEIGENLLSENGYDPFLEDIASVWLLHYMLIKTEYASIYNIIFNHLSNEIKTLTRQQLIAYIHRFLSNHSNTDYNKRTVEKDIQVFIKNYHSSIPKSSFKDIDEELMGLLTELRLLNIRKEKNIDNKIDEIISLENSAKFTLPGEILLFALIDIFDFDTTISVRDIYNSECNLASVFNLSKDDFIDKINDVCKVNDDITMSNTAGDFVIQIKNKLNKWKILENYYGK